MLPPLLCLQTIITNLLFYSPPSHTMPRGRWIWNHFPREHHHNDYLTLSGLFYFHLHLTCDQWHEIWVKLGPCPGEGNGNPLHYSCLENPLDRGAWWAAVHGVIQSRTWLKWLSMHACIGEGNGNPIQYSSLGNPRDRGAWWATVHRVAQRRTRLKWLSMHACMVLVLWGA